MNNLEKSVSESGLEKGITYIFEGEPNDKTLKKIQIQAEITDLEGEILGADSSQTAHKPRATIKQEIIYPPDIRRASHVGKSVSIMGPQIKDVYQRFGKKTQHYYFIEYGENNPKSFSHILKGVPKTTSPSNISSSHLSSLLETVESSQFGGGRKTLKKRKSRRKTHRKRASKKYRRSRKRKGSRKKQN